MTNVDLYQQCPCGSGKKLKFCCGADIAHELESIQRALDGEQRVAALDLVQRAVATKGTRPALLMIQIELAVNNHNFEAAETAVRELVRQRPKDPAAVAIKSSVLAAKGDVRAAVDTLHDALELIPDKTPIPAGVAQAFQQLGALFVERGAILPGIAHFAAASQILGHQNTDLLSVLQRINSARDIPLAAKEMPPLAKAPDGVDWKATFESAVQLAERALWRKARNQFRIMAEGLSFEPSILKNLAITQTMLGDPKATAAAWRVYARLPNLPLDEAVEAEVQAQLADPVEPEMVATVTLRYPIKNIDACMEHLLSDRRCFNTPIDTANWDAEDGPPPKAVFMLLDRPLPVSAPDIVLADVPRLLGHLFVFGRQTDRPALLEVECDRDEDFEKRKSTLLEVAGEYLDAPLPEEVTDERAASSAAMSQGVIFPRDVPPAKQELLATELRHDLMVKRWIRVPLPECGGKSAAEAAQDPRQKIPLLAAILLTESALQQHGLDFNANAAREQLGLPRSEMIEIGPDHSIDKLPILRMSRVRPDTLSDLDLGRLIQRAVSRGLRLMQRRLSLEAVGRQSPESAGLALAACEVLTTISRETEEAMSWIEKGRQIAAAHNLPVGRLKVLELEMRLMRGEYEVFAGLLKGLLENEARQDRDVGMLLYSTMMRLGLVTQEGKFVIPMPKSRTSPLGPAEGGGAAAGGLWTPGAPAAPTAAPASPAAAAGKSKLWLPGMD